jgi:hypothetical protein
MSHSSNNKSFNRCSGMIVEFTVTLWTSKDFGLLYYSPYDVFQLTIQFPTLFKTNGFNSSVSTSPSPAAHGTPTSKIRNCLLTLQRGPRKSFSLSATGWREVHAHLTLISTSPSIFAIISHTCLHCSLGLAFLEMDEDDLFCEVICLKVFQESSKVIDSMLLK